METSENSIFKKSAAAAVVVGDGLHAAAYAGIQRPIDALKQTAQHILKVDLPNTNFINAPREVSPNSASGIAEAVGTAAGMLPWIYASHKIVGSVASGLERNADKALTSKSLGIIRAGLTGATYTTLFKPVDNNGNYFAEKAEDAGIAFTTFASGAGINNALRARFGTFETRATRLTFSSSVGAVSGIGAGVVNAELNNLTGHEHVNPLRTGLEYGILGGVLGARLAGEFKETGKQSMSMDEPVERNILGIKPETLSKQLDAVRTQYGENSVEHADHLIRIGDAHMTQGSIANPEAQAHYERALKIFTDTNQSNAMIAKAYDKLANVKESSGDTRGAAADLAKAIEHWQTDSTNADFVQSNYFARRLDDLRRLQNVNTVRYGHPRVLEEEH